MNNNKKNLLVGGLVLLIGLNSGVVNAETVNLKKDNLVTVNLYNQSNQVVSNYTAEEDDVIPKSVQKELDNTDISFGSCGIQTKEVVVKPEPIVSNDTYKASEQGKTTVVRTCSVPDSVRGCNSAFKSYMSYTSVTSVSSPQYKLLRSSKTYTDKNTGFRMHNGRICIAMGSGYAYKIGTKINLVMANGNVVKCILGDQKANRDTDSTHRFQRCDGSVAEIIIDYRYFHSTRQYPKALNGKIKRVEIVK